MSQKLAATLSHNSNTQPRLPLKRRLAKQIGRWATAKTSRPKSIDRRGSCPSDKGGLNPARDRLPPIEFPFPHSNPAPHHTPKRIPRRNPEQRAGIKPGPAGRGLSRSLSGSRKKLRSYRAENPKRQKVRARAKRLSSISCGERRDPPMKKDPSAKHDEEPLVKEGISPLPQAPLSPCRTSGPSSQGQVPSSSRARVRRNVL